MKTYFYETNKIFLVSEDTIEKNPHTFWSNGDIAERNEIIKFFNYIEPNGSYNVVDVGAQSGLYSIFAKFLPNSKFYSFEPFKENYSLLIQNLELNNINNVQTFNLAISDTLGKREMCVCDSHNGLHTFGSNPLRFNDYHKEEIECVTLDSMFFDKDIKIDFLKIDTEGWEYFIIKGGLKSIEKYRPVIQLEWHKTNMEQCGVIEKDLIQLIESLDYEFVGGIKTTGEESIIVPKSRMNSI